MYISTRENFHSVSAAEAIKLGMVPTGGLFVPQVIPHFSVEEISMLGKGTYQHTAEKVLGLFLDDFSPVKIVDCVERAYAANFDRKEITPCQQISANLYVLELWHGPTAAFKDMALQLMPLLLAEALEILQVKEEIVVLVATSGDTGKAALEGFKDIPGMKIICFYPYGGVSLIQERQMLTTEGENTYVVGVKGNFDDCQNAVKSIFGDEALRSMLADRGIALSSANSINWGRLLPQIVYYVYTYANLLAKGKIQPGEKVNFVVPTGNFGNILAAWYASQMGVPVNKLICASNENNVLTDFFHTGKYEKNRSFKQTNSPSMDILVSSNLERFLFEMNNRQGKVVAGWMRDLQKKGSFTVGQEVREKIKEILWAGFASEKETLATIKATFLKSNYILDTHTAVGMKVYEKYLMDTQDQTLTVLDATASPFKFPASVWEALTGDSPNSVENEFHLLQKLSKMVGLPIHTALQELEEKPILHQNVCANTDIREMVQGILKLR